MSRYAKTVTALVTGYLGWAAQVVASKPAHITASEWIAAGVVAAVGLGVYGMPNAAPAPPSPPPPPAPRLVAGPLPDPVAVAPAGSVTEVPTALAGPPPQAPCP